MTQTVLARKWRPQTFEQIVGQKSVTQALMQSLIMQRIHHAYLFTGIQGSGKTTLARILAKCLCCETGISAKPCEICQTCQDITAGCYPELIEVDAASRTRVEETRDLLDNIVYMPTRGRFKIYLIDEVHMLSTHSFNALLKTLEEPPEHAKFILATTDPQKIPATILSRCLQYALKPVNAEEIAAHLAFILEQEHIPAMSDALFAIAQSAQGSVRDALSLLDQAIAYSAGNVTIDAVRNMLGLVSADFIYELLGAVAKQDAKKLLEQIALISQEGFGFDAVLGEMLVCLQRAATLQLIPQWDIKDAHEQSLRDLARNFSAQMIQLLYSIVLMGRRDLMLAPNSRSAFEMVMLRLFAFSPQEVNVKDVSVSSVATPVVSLPPAAPASMKQEPINSAQRLPAQKQPPSERVFINNQAWEEVVEHLKLVGVACALAKNSVLVAYDGEKATFMLSAQHEPLYHETQQQRIAQALSQYVGKEIAVHFKIGATAQETPMAASARVQRAAKTELIETMRNDPGVQLLEKELGARLDIESIQQR